MPTLELPEIEFELTQVELIDPNALQGDDGPGEDEPPPILVPPPPPESEEPEPPPPPPKPAIEPKPKPKPRPKRPPTDALTHPDAIASDTPPRRTLGSKRSDVDNLGPTNSTFYFFLVPEKIRTMEHAQAAMDIMASFPDFEFLVDDGGFNPLEDFDHLVISTPNLTDPRQTFLVVDYKMSRDEVQRTLDRAAAARGERIEWLDKGDALVGNPMPTDNHRDDWDPRWFVLPTETKIAAYIREEFLPALLQDDVGEEKTAANYVANLAKLRSFAEQIPTAGFQVVLKDAHAAVRRVHGLQFPLPDAIELTVEAAAAPEVLIRATFLTPLDAKEADLFLREGLPQMIDTQLALPVRWMVKPLYNLLKIEQSETEVRVWAHLDARQTAKYLEYAGSLVAKIQRKDAEELEASRRKRLENWELRREGKHSPAELDRLATERDARDREPAAEAAPLDTEPPTIAEGVSPEPTSVPPADSDGIAAPKPSSPPSEPQTPSPSAESQ